MKARILKLRNDLGIVGIAGLALLAAALGFSHLVVKPLEEKTALLARRAAPQAEASGGQASAKVAKVYEYLQKEENATDWLAKLHGIGVATGVQLKSANYRTQKTDGRIVRYEIVLPVTGSYGQIRDFLKRSLAEIPVMSVDQLTLRRENSGSGQGSGPIQAEMRLTLHMVKT